MFGKADKSNIVFVVSMVAPFTMRYGRATPAGLYAWHVCSVPVLALPFDDAVTRVSFHVLCMTVSIENAVAGCYQDVTFDQVTCACALHTIGLCFRDSTASLNGSSISSNSS